MKESCGKRIKQRLEQLNMKQADLSERTKINKATISQYVNGKYLPTQERVEALSKVLNVTPAWLMGYNVPMTSEEPNVEPVSLGKTVQIPVYGRIPAGVPLEAIECIDEYVDIPLEWTKTGDKYFALRVKGDSMSPKYLDEDYVIIRQQPDCESGQDAAVRVNGTEATLKKVVKMQYGIILQPLNPAYDAKQYDYNDEFNPVEIMGVVVELRRKM